MINNRFEISFKAKKENIAIVRNMVGIALLDNNPTITFINEVKTIVSEGITNSIIHGYSSDETKTVLLILELSMNNLLIEIIDEGVGIENIEEAKEPLFTTKASEERSGLGFTIMELFSTSMKIESKVGYGTHLYIEKNW